MIVLLSGLVAAVVWAVGTLASARLMRVVTSATALAWVSVLELVMLAPALALGGTPHVVTGSTLAWLIVSGVTSTMASFFAYAAMKRGKVGIVAPIISIEGGIAALIAVLGGEHLAMSTVAVLIVVTVGVMIASVAKGHGSELGNPALASILAVMCAASSGTNLYAVGRLSTELSIAWTLLPAKAVSALIFTVPLLVARRMRISRWVALLALFAGAGELLGFGAYAYGSRHGIAVTAVTASLFAPLAAVCAFLLFRDRLSRLQILGVTTVAVGVAVLAGLNPS